MAGAAALFGALLALVPAMAQSGPGPETPPPAGGSSAEVQPQLLKPLPLPAVGARPPSDDPRDFEGVYTTHRTRFPRANLPLTPKARAEFDLDMQRMKQGKPTGGLAALCRPEPTFTLGSDLFPGEIVQTAQQVILLNEEHRTRVNVYMDRDHPQRMTPSYFGDSVGKWDGDTLVIDTVGFNGREPTVSTQAHVVTRIRKIDGGRRLEFVSTITDPINLTMPVTNTYNSDWNPDVQILEFQCEENLAGSREGLTVDK